MSKKRGSTRINGNSALKYIVYFRSFVSIIIVISIVITPIGLSLAPEIDEVDCPLMPHQFRYMPYLISLWGSCIASIYFLLYSVIDYILYYKTPSKKLMELKEVLHRIGSYMLFAGVFPICSILLEKAIWAVFIIVTLVEYCDQMVSAVFWAMYFMYKDVTYPDLIESLVPSPLNHMMHTFPPFIAIIYMVISNKYEPSKSTTFVGMVAVLSAYASGLGYIKLRDGKWAYWALESISPTEVTVALTSGVLSAVVFFFLGYAINSKVKCLKKYLPPIA